MDTNTDSPPHATVVAPPADGPRKCQRAYKYLLPRERRDLLAASGRVADALADIAPTGKPHTAAARAQLSRIRRSAQETGTFKAALVRQGMTTKRRAEKWVQGVAWMDAEEVTRNALGLQALRQVSKLCGDYPEHGTGAAQANVTINLGLLNDVVRESLKDVTPRR